VTRRRRCRATSPSGRGRDPGDQPGARVRGCGAWQKAAASRRSFLHPPITPHQLRLGPPFGGQGSVSPDQVRGRLSPRLGEEAPPPPRLAPLELRRGPPPPSLRDRGGSTAPLEVPCLRRTACALRRARDDKESCNTHLSVPAAVSRPGCGASSPSRSLILRCRRSRPRPSRPRLSPWRLRREGWRALGEHRSSSFFQALVKAPAAAVLGFPPRCGPVGRDRRAAPLSCFSSGLSPESGPRPRHPGFSGPQGGRS
jgi:hypothetical protein